jgi:DNA (cytosine-5)-methyltransferase 1
VENVSALLGRGLGDVLGDLSKIGYDAEWHCIPASYVGAWHRRDRVWVVAHPQCERRRQRLSKEQILGKQDVSGPSPRVSPQWPGRPNLPAPYLCGGSDGVPDRTHRLKALGNAVVPQIPELLGRAILRSMVAQ